MSKTIDSRVVEMQFNNKQFERNVSTTMSTLDKLKRSLNMDGASKGLDSVSAAAKNVDMSGLSGAVETVRLKFSALEVMAITALVNITNSAINAGKNIAKSLTIEPITDGFQEYEMVLNAVQTTMAGTGKTAEEVEEQLKRLDQYADDTVYSTNDMLSNLPKFTNAGVDLEKATTAMIGIANATALAGGDARSASIAFYNLGQSIGTGYLTRMDYNSINNAGIATMEWKNQMIEAALAQGSLTKVGEDAYKAGKKTYTLQSLFIDGLQEQWASTDVLMSVFEDYGDVTTEIGKKAQASAQDLKTYTMMMESLQATAGTGWKDTWQILFGDLEEAKVLWTSIGDAIGKVISDSAEARNKVLQDWKDLGGRDLLIESFANAFEALGRVITPIKEAFRDFFPAKTGDQLFAMTEALHAFTEKIKIGDETSDKLRRTFAGLFAVLDLVKQGIGFVFNVAGELFGLFGGPAAGGILGVTASIGDLLVKLNEAVREGNIFKRAFETFKEVFTTVADKIADAITRIKEAFGGFRSVDIGPIDEFSSKAEKSFSPFTRIAQIFGVAFEAIVKVLEWAAPIVAKLGSIVAKGLGALADKVSYAVEHMEFNEILDIINTGLFGAILLGIRNFIKSLTDITSEAGGFIEGLTGILDGVRGSLEAYQSSLKAKTLLTIASAIGILAASLVVLSMIDSAKLTTALMGITVLFIELSAAMIVLGNTMGNVNMVKVSGTMVAMSVAILILSNAMKNLAALDWEGVAKGTVGIAALAATLVIAANSFDKTSGKLIKGSTGLIAFAAAVLILSHAVDNLAQLSWGELLKGLTGLTVILIEIVALTRLMGDSKRMISTGLGMIALGAAVNIFASAIAKMGQLTWGEIARGLTTMAGALTAVTIALNFMPKGMINKATGLVVLGSAMLIFASAISKMGQLSWKEIARGMTAMAGALTAITVALNFMPKGMIGMGVGLIAIGTALLIVSKALGNMGGMSWDEVAKGLVALGGSLLVIAVAMTAMTGGLAGAAAMLVMAAAIRMFTPALISLGSMDLVEIGKALLALVGVFAVVGVAGLLLAPLTPVILGLAAAIALLGVGVLAIGAGLLAFSAGLTALAVAGTAGAAALVVIVTSLISLIPMVLEKIGEGIIAFAGVISNGTPAIIEAVRQIALGLIQVLVEITPPVVEALLTFLVTLLEQLANAVPQMIDAGMRLLLGILEGISEHIMDVVVVALNIISEFLRGIAEGIPGIISAGVDIVVNFLTAIGRETPRIIDAGFKMIVDFINGLADAIRKNTPVLGAAMGNLAGAMIDGLVGGIMAGVGSVADSVKNLGKNALNGLKSFLGIHSPSREFENLGRYTSEGFAQGVKGNEGRVTSTVSEMSRKMLTTLNSSAPNFKKAGSALMVSFISGVKSQDVNVTSTFTKMISDWLTAVKKKTTEFQIVGQQSMTQFVAGIKSNDKLVNSAFVQAVSGALTSIRNRYSDFYYNGRYLVEGFASGITSYTYLAEARARSMAYAASAAARSQLAIRSPSRVGYEIGEYFGLGFVNAIDDYASKSYEAGSEIADSAKSGLSNTLAKITDFINDDLDIRPVIRPVLELDKMRTDELDSLFANRKINGRMANIDTRGLNNAHLLNSQQKQNVTYNQNDYKTEVDNRGLLEGAVFHVREEADIRRIVREIDRITDEKFAKKGIKVVPV